jgi:hypothetical protein
MGTWDGQSVFFALEKDLKTDWKFVTMPNGVAYGNDRVLWKVPGSIDTTLPPERGWEAVDARAVDKQIKINHCFPVQ